MKSLNAYGIFVCSLIYLFNNYLIFAVPQTLIQALRDHSVKKFIAAPALLELAFLMSRQKKKDS